MKLRRPNGPLGAGANAAGAGCLGAAGEMQTETSSIRKSSFLQQGKARSSWPTHVRTHLSSTLAT